AGNQSNPSADFQDKFDAEKAEEESDQQYVLFPVWSFGSTNPQNTDEDVTFDEKEPEFEGSNPESEVNVSPSSKFEDYFDNNINKDNAVGTLVPAVGQISPNSTNTFSAVGPSNAVASLTLGKSSKADFNNLETSITASPILTKRVHKDHPVTQIISDLSSATQTRSMTRVDKDQGHTQEEGIDYKEVFAPVERNEAIRLFLGYASFMGFMVYQMDVKSAFLYGTIKKEVYVCPPLGFEDPDYPDKKKDGIFISQDKYVAEILRKFRLTDIKSASTPIDTEKPLLKDPDDEDVDVHT
nr:putative ribonuclease H-like domain-containing protein [Tanacetum cinerariifolium]